MRVLASFLPIAAMHDAARREAIALTERWDVPNGKDVHADLRDRKGRMFRTREGYRIAGRLLVDDLSFGSASPVVPVLMALLPVLALLTMFGDFGKLVGGVGLIVLLATLSSCVRPLHLVGLIVVGLLLPVGLGSALTQATGMSGPGLQSVMGLARNPMGLLAPVALLAAVWMFSGFKMHVVRGAAVALAVLIGLGVLVQLLPSSLRGFYWYAIATLAPMIYAWSMFKVRSLRLVVQGQQATMESTGKLSGSHIKARQEQAKAAASDMSAFLPLGVATGRFSSMNDGFAPDAGLPFGNTVNDQSTHLAIFGSSGSGKTSSVLRPRIVSYLRSGAGGLVIMDAKGALAGEFRGMRDYTLIEPGVKLGLIEGLSPNDIVTALYSVAMGDTKPGGSGKYFNDAGRDMLRHTAVLLEGFVVVEKQQREQDPAFQRKFFWTVEDLYAMLNNIQVKSASLEASLAFLREHNDLVARGGLLDDAIHYAETVLPGLPEETRGNTMSTVANWLTPLMSHPDILPWAKTETGVDVLTPLRWKSLGVVLPEFIYGFAGIAVQSLIKQRLFSVIKKRGTYDWKAAGESPVMFCIDEAQGIVGTDDLALLPVGRSLGAVCVYATQTVDVYLAKFGEKEALAFLDNFRSFVSFRSSPATYEWIKQRLGMVQTLVFSAAGGGIDFGFSAKLLAESPLVDPNHPSSGYYKSLLRRGAGAMRTGKGSNELGGHVSDAGNDLDLSINPVRGGEWKIRPLLDEAEWSIYTAERGVAIAQVMRGGVPRRDVIKTAPMDDIPADLLQEVA